MRRLIIDTATAALSLALVDDRNVVAQFDDVIGRGHAERLIPAIADLPDGGRCDEILVDLGPGSFTGVRIGIAAARALALAWGVRCRGFTSAAAIAASARGVFSDLEGTPFLIVMEGGHGEWLVTPVDPGCVGQTLSLAPDEAVLLDREIMVGSRAKEAVALRGSGEARMLLPSAQHAVLIPGEAMSDSLSPIYARGPDATPMKPA